jgi:capsular exopolysaccharide synthesis family protein
VDRADNVGQVSPVPNQARKLFTFFALLIPIAFIAIKEFMSNKIIDPKRLEGQLNVPLISIIGRSEEEDALPVLVNPQSTVTESFRSLRADISYLSDNKDNLTMLFTSTISGEGKTFLAMNLASIYSLMGKKTLLLGLDLRKPKIAKEFGLTNDIGISTILSSKVTWKEALKSSGHANFDIILSGPIPPNPAELLLTNKFVETLEELKKEYEIIIFDCPPVGLVSETKELFRLADLNFFVFRQGFSEKASTEFLNNLVEKGGVKKIYGILNDMHIEKGYSYGAKYGYGYGKNYKGYYTEDNESSRLKRWIKRNNK